MENGNFNCRYRKKIIVVDHVWDYNQNTIDWDGKFLCFFSQVVSS